MNLNCLFSDASAALLLWALLFALTYCFLWNGCCSDGVILAKAPCFVVPLKRSCHIAQPNFGDNAHGPGTRYSGPGPGIWAQHQFEISSGNLANGSPIEHGSSSFSLIFSD